MTTTVATLTGSVTPLSDEALAQLRMTLRGQVLTPHDAGYAAVRPAYNAMHPGNPALVVLPSGTADVIDAVNFAREHALLVAVRGGGHSVAGLSSVDGGMLIDLALMRSVDVDPEARIARVQGGALWGDVDRETQALGLVAPGGVVSDTGVAGLTLGGGQGWVRRKYGLSCDNLLSAQLVCADGQLRTASADVNPDLFWAIRGGGGNFGIATSMTFQLHPLGPIVAFTGVFYPVVDAVQVWRGFRDWASAAPDEVSALCACTTLPAHEALPPQIHDTPFIVVGAVYTGDPDDGMKVMEPLRSLATPLVDISQPLPFTAVQAAFDPFFVRGTLRSYWKSTYLHELSDEVIDLLAQKAAERPSKRAFAPITFLMGGAINRVKPKDTAYSERSANWMLSIDGNWSDPAEDSTVISWVRQTWEELAKFGTGGVYLNFRSLSDETPASDVENAFGDNMRRLVEVKAKYDPTNFFRLNNNITPAS
jgi:FAD binding domain-containing protein/berberine-like enzyme